jgi:hypothetical protein
LLTADLNESDAINQFHMKKADLQEMADKLWPKFASVLPGEKEKVHVRNGYKVPYETGLLILLYQLSRPRTIHPDMEKYFGIQQSCLLAIIYTFSEVFYAVAIPYLSDPTFIFHHQMQYDYADFILGKTNGLVANVWGFIDGTLQKTTRSSYSGHKRSHGIKFQSVVVPDGLIALLFGPINGCHFCFFHSCLVP